MFIFVHVNFSCFDNITAKNSKTKCYKQLYLSRCSGGGGGGGGGGVLALM